MAAAVPPAVMQTPTGMVAVGHQSGRVLVHLDRARDFLNVSGADALALAYQLVAAARAAGAVPPSQRTLF